MYIGPWQELQLARSTLQVRDAPHALSLDDADVAELESALKAQFADSEADTADKVLAAVRSLMQKHQQQKQKQQQLTQQRIPAEQPAPRTTLKRRLRHRH